MSARNWDVLAFGAVAVDEICYVDRFPSPDTKQPIVEMQRQPGGLAGTVAVTASRLGVRTAYCGVLGNNDLSRYILDDFAREGVAFISGAVASDARPFHSVIIVVRSDGTRTILHSNAGVTAPAPDGLTAELIGQARVIFVDQTVAATGIRAARIARQLRIPVVADVESGENDEIAELIELVDHLIVGIELGSRLAASDDPVTIVKALGKSGRAVSVVTAGDRGCWWCEGAGEVHHVPAYRVAVVDTTGCGDVFHGAYAAAIASGNVTPVAVRWAAAAAAMKAAHPSGRVGIPRQAELQRFMAQA